MGCMRSWARIPALGILVLVIASMIVAVAPPARAAMARPTWTAGDSWTYAISFGTGSSTLNGTLRMDVSGTENVAVNGTSYPTYHVAAVASIPLGGSLTFTVPADIWFSSDTLAIVKTRAVVNLTFGNISAGSTLTVSGNPPQTLHWPLTTDDSWMSTTTVWTITTPSSGPTEYASASLTTSFVVQPDATITVPAGSFPSTPLKETDEANGSYTMNYWSATVGNWAMVGFYSSSGTQGGSMKLTSCHYQGGGFLSQVVFGLPVYLWLILAVIVLVGIVAFAVVRRRRPPAMVAVPPPMQAAPPPTTQGPPPSPPGPP